MTSTTENIAPPSSIATVPISEGHGVNDAEEPIAGSAAPKHSQAIDENALPAMADRPGSRDDLNFSQHWSVAYWRAWSWPPKGVDLQTANGLSQVVTAVLRNAQAANMLQDTTSAAFWAYHIARCAFFSVQGLSSVLLHSAVSGSLWRGEATWTTSNSFPIGKFILNSSVNLPGEAMGAFSQDLRSIKAGEYALPWDMVKAPNRQLNPLIVASKSAEYMREAVRVLNARRERRVGDLWFGKSDMYPDYYINNFHFQTDGWFSSRSASVYEFATETLFVGRQDAMQRGTLVPMTRHLKDNRPGAGLRFLEVGAGTGRVATFVRDNFPAADITVSDLSPFYLQEARKNMSYWESLNRDVSVGTTDFMQCAAERLPYDDASMDVVYSVYMFHEMPKTAREAALREFSRVLKPGGLLVITDSMQLGDRPDRDEAIGSFQSFNEPHYRDFTRFDFGAAMQDAGLKPDMKVLQSASKTLSAVKPQA